MKQALADAIEARGYDTLTPVQEACGNPALEGRDLLVSAQTGSGKTLGFGIAIAPNLLGDAERFDRADAPLALVIAPTRELALQVKRELEWLYEKTGAVIASTVGGMDMRDERRALGRGAHIVVSTPGRLRDHIMRKSIDLSNLKAVVLDEADEMLDLGFREDLEFILDESPKDRQTLLFSATVPASIAKLSQRSPRTAEPVPTPTADMQHAACDDRPFRTSPRARPPSTHHPPPSPPHPPLSTPPPPPPPSTPRLAPSPLSLSPPYLPPPPLPLTPLPASPLALYSVVHLER